MNIFIYVTPKCSITILDIGAFRKHSSILKDRVRQYVDEECVESRTTSLANGAISSPLFSRGSWNEVSRE